MVLALFTMRALAEEPAAVGSISGRLIDTLSGEPMRGDVPFFERVELHRCEGETCRSVGLQPLGADGRFRMERDGRDRPLHPGTFYASVMRHAVTQRFVVRADEHFVLGDVAVALPGMSLGQVTPCAGLPVAGGTCTYSVRVRNNSARSVTGSAASATLALDRGRSIIATPEQLEVSIPAFESQELGFSVMVPGDIRKGTGVCPTLRFDVDVGPGTAPPPLKPREAVLFCLLREPGGFRLANADETVTAANRALGWLGE